MGKKQTQTFLHSGDMGDIIYSLPTIRALGGGKIFLDPLWEATLFNENNARLLIPLLIAQSYIADAAIYNGEAIDYDLNKFRNIGLDLGLTNLVESHLRAFNLPIRLMNEQWLFNIGKKKVFDRDIIFHRSLHHHNDNFPWEVLTKQFKKKALFIGLREEHERFVDLYGMIPFYQVYDFLEMAEIINGADCFFGNQSFPFAVSEGLHKLNYLEVCENCPNCNFNRKGHNLEKE